jgi:hypothetical protein
MLRAIGRLIVAGLLSVAVVGCETIRHPLAQCSGTERRPLNPGEYKKPEKRADAALAKPCRRA